MKTFKTFVNEEKLSRVWAMATKESGVFGLITAFRGDNSLKENTVLNKKLMSDVRSAGFGYWVLSGRWIETTEDGKKIDVGEETLFISAPKDMENKGAKLKDFIIKMVKKYDQDAAVFKTDESKDVIKLFIYKEWKDNKRVVSNKIISIGKFTPNKIADAYSKIRGSGRTFVFEGVIDTNPTGFMNAIVKQSTERNFGME